jgi:hypothetical protein
MKWIVIAHYKSVFSDAHDSSELYVAEYDNKEDAESDYTDWKYEGGKCFDLKVTLYSANIEQEKQQ